MPLLQQCAAFQFAGFSEIPCPRDTVHDRNGVCGLPSDATSNRKTSRTIDFPLQSFVDGGLNGARFLDGNLEVEII